MSENISMTYGKSFLFPLLICLFFVAACGFKAPPKPPGKSLPAIPQNLSTRPTANGYTISWEITGEAPAGFKVYRAPFEKDCVDCPTIYTLRAVLGSEARKFEDFSDPEHVYLYEVRGFLEGGAQGPASQVSTARDEAGEKIEEKAGGEVEEEEVEKGEPL